jgi:hypothetical protein
LAQSASLSHCDGASQLLPAPHAYGESSTTNEHALEQSANVKHASVGSERVMMAIAR